MKKYTEQPEGIFNILKSINISAPWIETRGRPQKYSFYDMQPGQIITKPVPLNKARNIQTAIKNAANRQRVKITIQNKGQFLKIKRIK